MADWRIVTPTREPEDDEINTPSGFAPGVGNILLSPGNFAILCTNSDPRLSFKIQNVQPVVTYYYDFTEKTWLDSSFEPIDITTVDLVIPEAAITGATVKTSYFNLIAFEEGTTACKLAVTNEAKTLIRNALINKGVDVPDTTPFRQYAGKAWEIQNGGSRITSISVLTGGGPNQTFEVKFPVSVFSGATEYTPNKGIILGSVSEVTFTCDCELSELLTSPGILYQFFKNSGSLPDPTVNITISVSGEALKVDGSAA